MDAGIVDQHVEPAEFPLGRCHRARPVNRTCGVQMHVYRAPAGEISRQLARKVSTEVIEEIAEDDVGASLHQHSRLTGADPARRPADDCYFPDKSSGHRRYLPRHCSFVANDASNADNGIFTREYTLNAKTQLSDAQACPPGKSRNLIGNDDRRFAGDIEAHRIGNEALGVRSVVKGVGAFRICTGGDSYGRTQHNVCKSA
jgi:hypothetical protein